MFCLNPQNQQTFDSVVKNKFCLALSNVLPPRVGNEGKTRNFNATYIMFTLFLNWLLLLCSTMTFT